MKKSALIFVIPLSIFLGLGYWWSQKTLPPRPQTDVAKSPEAILKSDFEKITVHLNQKSIESNEWKLINDYAQPATALVNKDNAKNFFAVTKTTLPDIYSCLKKDFCGMQTRSDEDPYFDEGRTPAHILMNRNLQIMQETLRTDSTLAKDIDWVLMEELAGLNSEMLSVLALEIMREFHDDTVKTEDLIKLSKHAKGETRANSLLSLSKKGTSLDKMLIANEIENVFASEDANTVISVLEKVKSMTLNATQIPDVLRNLCRFKNENSHNWPMIKLEANKIDSQFESICN